MPSDWTSDAISTPSVWLRFLLVTYTEFSSTLYMETIPSPETSLIYQTTQLHISEESILHRHLCEILKSNEDTFSRHLGHNTVYSVSLQKFRRKFLLPSSGRKRLKFII
jgi:hypothetical protein